MNRLQRAKQESERLRWRMLCAFLLEYGAVTPDDLEASRFSQDTPGQRIIHAIREWGDAARGEEAAFLATADV